MEQFDSQLMMADQGASEATVSAAVSPRYLGPPRYWATLLDQRGERGPDAGWRVLIRFQREDLCLGLSREPSGRVLNPGQAALGDDDLVSALFGDQTAWCMAEPGGGAGDESHRISHGRLHGERVKVRL